MGRVRRLDHTAEEWPDIRFLEILESAPAEIPVQPVG